MAKFNTSAAQKIEKFLDYVMAQDAGEYGHALCGLVMLPI